MVAGAEVIHHGGVAVLDVQYLCITRSVDEIADVAVATPPMSPAFLPPSEVDLRETGAAPIESIESSAIPFVPRLRSGSFSDIGSRRYMEDEHICVDDLSTRLGSVLSCPTPCAFYGVFDGHGGSDAAAYIRRHVLRIFFEDSEFPRSSQADDTFLDEAENTIRKAFLHADLELADDCTVSSSSGTTVLTAMVFGSLLLVANAGDCRAVLCRRGEVVEMSQDHRPIYVAERQRVETCGGYVDDGGYLNGVLSVSRALGDWDMKQPPQGGSCSSSSPLIAEPEFRRTVLTEDDEFLIIGCDGIWDVMSSRHAVGMVRRGLRRHGDAAQCARELVMEALRLNTHDNLTVVVVGFSGDGYGGGWDGQQQQAPRLRCCSLSTEALCNLRSWLE